MCLQPSADSRCCNLKKELVRFCSPLSDHLFLLWRSFLGEIMPGLYILIFFITLKGFKFTIKSVKVRESDHRSKSLSASWHRGWGALLTLQQIKQLQHFECSLFHCWIPLHSNINVKNYKLGTIFKAMKLYIKIEIEEKKKSAPLLRFQLFHVDLDEETSAQLN